MAENKPAPHPTGAGAQKVKKILNKTILKSDYELITVAPRYENNDRGAWASKMESLLSCIGYAVGLGNVWRFPYLCYRSGGGAFLIPYFIMLFLCGIPLFLMEMVLGQFSSTGAVGIFRMSPFFKGVGYAIVVVNFICVCYYAVVVAYPLRFLAAIFVKDLPWEHCNNEWNTKNCVEINEFVHRNTSAYHKTPAEEFFHLKVLELSDGIAHMGGMVWPLFLCLLAAYICIYVCIMKGVATVGKVVYFTATFPYVILFILFVRGVTLPGAVDGILFYISPEWKRLTDLKVWTDAAIQIFFSLGPGWGGIVNIASFNGFRNNVKFDSIFIPIVNCGTSIFAGFVVFSVLGYLAHQTGLPVATVATSGPGLAFITYPQAIAMLPIPHLWSVLFYFMLFLLGLDSVFVQIESIVSAVVDCIPKLRPHKYYVIVVFCLVCFSVSTIMVTRAGMYILQLLDWYSASIAVILICFMEITMVSYVYGVKNFCNDYLFMLGHKPPMFYKICWKYVTPILLIIMFFTTIIFNRNVEYNHTAYPAWAIGIGWLSCISSIIFIPIHMIYVLCSSKKNLRETLKLHLRAHDWAPAAEDHRAEYHEFKENLHIQEELEKTRKLNERRQHQLQQQQQQQQNQQQQRT